ncbi:glycosyl hydrolase family 28-related protein [Novosphingobium pokkalii]|uniref:glycosyl hydrolase family 28-related protein n=1 Tax=Novosphingobium pokkalii TaxID=1770194 RepID=UPI0036457231
MKSFSYGLTLPGLGLPGTYEMRMDQAALAALPRPGAPAIRPLPAPAQWANVRALGVSGDGHTDDTAALQRAIATHRVLYFPIGRYVVSDTLTLRPDSVLIGLHPDLTQIVLPDGTPAFQGVGAPRALVLAPPGETPLSPVWACSLAASTHAPPRYRGNRARIRWSRT